MLTYPLNKESGRSLYEQLYEGIRRDILSGTLPAHQRLPSKRALAQHPVSYTHLTLPTKA